MSSTELQKLGWKSLNTEDRIALLKRVCIPGQTTAQMAAQVSMACGNVSVSRNSIIGMFKRHAKALLPLSLIEKGTPGYAEINRRVIDDMCSRNRKTKPSSDIALVFKFAFKLPMPKTMGITLLDLKSRQCHNPVDIINGVTYYCGAPNMSPDRYCISCHRKIWVPVEHTRRLR